MSTEQQFDKEYAQQYGGRPTKLTGDRVKAICDRLRVMGGREESARAAGVTYQSFLNWYHAGQKAEKKRESSRTDKDRACLRFRDDVDQAEAEAKLRAVASVAKASYGYEKVQTTTRSKVVYREKCTKHPDGSITTEKIPEVVTEIDTVRVHEFDARVAIEFLKRRYPKDWGDRQKIDIQSLDDEDLIRLLESQAGGGGG